MGNSVEPLTGTEEVFAEVLSGVVGADRVRVDGHFFDDLGADSMVMARFCARVRKRPDLPPVSMKDIYRHPTIRSLARALEVPESAPSPQPPPEPAEVAKPVTTSRYVLCGALQFLSVLCFSYLAAFVFASGYDWITAGTGTLDIYLRAVLFGAASFLGLGALPVVAKWTLVGRWTPREIPLWSLAYLRFWIVKTLIRTSPLVLFAGSPLYLLYLRALGVKIGRGAAVFSRHVPVCADLFTVGDGAVVRKDSYFNCYRAHGGVIQTGTVTVGKEAFVGEATVLDIGTSIGDGAQLGHTSSLHTGQAVPAGEHWHGSPAQRTELDYRLVGRAESGTARRAVYSGLQLLAMLTLSMPLTVGGAVLLLALFPRLNVFLAMGPVGAALGASAVLFSGAVLGGLLFVVTVPRVLSLAVKPDKEYPLYGLHYAIHRVIARTTNSKFFTGLFGDSSYVVHYLRGLGYDLSDVEQTGSNFGNQVKHESPYLSSVGTGTVVASGLSVVNADFSSTSFRVSRASIGPRNFLGNDIHYPSQGRTGENCLLATKVMVPIDGQVRENVGLLGSPCFEIPRTVERDARFDALRFGDELRRRLAAKNAYNLRTIGWFLLTRWLYTFLVTLTGFLVAERYGESGTLSIFLFIVLTALLGMAHFVLAERVSTGFRGLRPTYCSIYQADFWRTERFFKMTAPVPPVLNGTPFKAVLWRLLGVRVGRRLFDDGCNMSEKNLVTIGDNATLNENSVVQCHSQEDYTFKSDRIAIGADCTLGVGAFVHYGVTVGDGAVLAPDSFLMKGEEIPRHAQWGGNPARELRPGQSNRNGVLVDARLC